MPDHLVDSLAEYIRDLANKLELRDWRFRLERVPADANDDGVMAHIRCVYGRKLATIRVCERFAELSREEQRHTLAHELIHCHLDACHRVLENAKTNLGDAAWGVLSDCHRDAIELATDALADALAPSLPLWDHPTNDG